VILHQDNAPAHTSQTTQLELDLLTASDSLKDGLPSRSSSAKLSLPSANLLCHLNINERLTLLCFSDCFRVKNEVRDVINGDRRLTVREVADKCGISMTTVHQILGNDLNMNRACARWVPRILKRINIFFPIIFAFFGGGESQFFH
jgi:AraC-like DNA-binding protein